MQAPRTMPTPREKSLSPRAAALRQSLAPDHVVAVMIDEHERILGVLDRLEGRVLAGGRDPSSLAEINALAVRLLEAEPHHEREERVLFPALRARGVQGPPAVMEAEHMELRALKQAIHDASSGGDADEERWSGLRRDALALVELLRTHIHKENEILYPIAIQVVADPAEWERMKKRCDVIGYCCHHGDGNDSG